MKQGGSDDAKRAAGESAAEAVEDGMVVGLGTGSTAAHAIRAIGAAVDAGLDVTGVPTSFQSRELARDAGIPLTDLDAAEIDLAIDGADQVAGGDLVKGGGAAHAREKIVDTAADRLLVVVDPTKEADVLDHTVPLELLPAARRPVATAVERLGGEPTLRRAERKDGPVVTDNGNLVLDCAFGAIADPAALAADLATIPGVVEHGLFVDVADEVHCGTDDGVAVREL
ncbi:ribose-5-phosphate isomerase RpiA [Halomicrobium sp. IBSBa]|uniref:ribose-5-phosphate isomerase RpiA n=1 Tax=Halomicrobium sp. IBSBa TaxID=2778916 RepID=UPI001ABFF8A6|nr:ribose-5-phosphate isomerase RpiA [Halomicrobium sp. IBSBa]MBO4247946.1 ribose-5-phosphate isomerase RpiA [Halomicrobium sp. IBSBa]